VQPVQCGAASMANVARAAIESLYVSESKGVPWVRIPLSPPVHKPLNTEDLSDSRRSTESGPFGDRRFYWLFGTESGGCYPLSVSYVVNPADGTLGFLLRVASSSRSKAAIAVVG
jgi:hypothetical protein